MKINVHIDRLVLEGVSEPYDRGLVVRDAIANELMRLLAGVPLATFARRTISSVNGPDIQHRAADPAQVTGARIAGSVHAVIVGNKR